jgi:hypothetical protein
MIVLGADTHKRSDTIAAVSARTGELLGEQTVQAGAESAAVLPGWARGLGAERVWALEDCRHVFGLVDRARRAGSTCPAQVDGSLDASPEEEVTYLVSSFDHIDLARRRESYLATVILDLASVFGIRGALQRRSKTTARPWACFPKCFMYSRSGA